VYFGDLIIFNRWSKNFDEVALQWDDFPWEKFNVTLDGFCGQPVGMLIDSMRENPDVMGHWERCSVACGKILKSSPSKVPLIWIWISVQYIVPYPEQHLDQFNAA